MKYKKRRKKKALSESVSQLVASQAWEQQAAGEESERKKERNIGKSKVSAKERRNCTQVEQEQQQQQLQLLLQQWQQ